MRPIRIALTKGRLEKMSVQLFTKMGLDCTALIEKGRRLILPVGPYEVVLAKAADVITYIEHGVCDIGVVGKDTIVGNGRRATYEVGRTCLWPSRRFATVCGLGRGEDF